MSGVRDVKQNYSRGSLKEYYSLKREYERKERFYNRVNSGTSVGAGNCVWTNVRKLIGEPPVHPYFKGSKVNVGFHADGGKRAPKPPAQSVAVTQVSERKLTIFSEKLVVEIPPVQTPRKVSCAAVRAVREPTFTPLRVSTTTDASSLAPRKRLRSLSSRFNRYVRSLVRKEVKKAFKSLNNVAKTLPVQPVVLEVSLPQVVLPIAAGSSQVLPSVSRTVPEVSSVSILPRSCLLDVKEIQGIKPVNSDVEGAVDDQGVACDLVALAIQHAPTAFEKMALEREAKSRKSLLKPLPKKSFVTNFFSKKSAKVLDLGSDKSTKVLDPGFDKGSGKVLDLQPDSAYDQLVRAWAEVDETTSYVL